LAEEGSALVGKSGAKGRLLDVVTIRQIILARERGTSDGEIERRMELANETLELLGSKAIVGIVE